MGEWYEKSYRRNLVDMHIEDWDKAFLSKFDPEEYFRDLQLAHVASPMIYIQSHVGYCYWPTKTGKMHRAFEGREDAMKKLFDLCHGAGMDVIAYYSLIYNNWAYQEHPEWRMVSVSGGGSRDNDSRYGLCCPNNEGYRDFVRSQIDDFSRYFDFEGIFFDMTFWPMVCYCDSCKARWAKEVGGDIPNVVDWSDKRWLEFQKKRQEWLGEFAFAINDRMKLRKPKCSVEHQYSTAMQFWRFGVNDNIARASDYVGGDLYGGLAEQSFACKLYYNSSLTQPFEYMTSRCHPNLKEHTTSKSQELLSLDVMTTIFHHGACVMIDAIDPIGTMDRRVYERLGTAYADATAYEPWLKGDLVQDVGIYYNLNGKMDPDGNGIVVGSPESEDTFHPHQIAALGAAKALREHHIPFGVVPNWRPELFGKFSVLVLPDVSFMSDAEIAAVRDYVKAGGRLYLSGRSAPRLVEEFFGGRISGLTKETTTYIGPTELGEPLMPGFTRDYPMALAFQQTILEGAKEAEVLATMTLPFTVPQLGHTPGALLSGSPSLDREEYLKTRRFASIHSDPPGKATTHPSILRAKIGKGIVIWASAPFEGAGRPPHEAAFASIIASLGDGFSFSSDAPDVVELVMFAEPDKSRRYLGILNLQDRFSPLPLQGFQVEVKTERKPHEILSIPDRKALPFSYADGYAKFAIERLATNYTMVEVVS